MQENRRLHTRYQVAIVAEIELTEDTLTGETRDISMGGVSIILNRKLQKGSVVDLALILTQDGIEDPNEEPFETKAKVVWEAPSEKGGVMVGMQFTKLDRTKEGQLQRFLSALDEDAES